MDVSKIYTKNAQYGISRPLGSQEIQKTKVATVLRDTLYIHGVMNLKYSAMPIRSPKGDLGPLGDFLVNIGPPFVPFYTKSTLSSCLLQFATFSVGNACSWQRVHFATRAVGNACTLQHGHFATHALCNACTLQHLQFEEYPHLYYGSE